MVLGLLMEMRGNWLGSWCWLAMEAGRLAYQLENRQMPCPWRGSPNPSSLGDELGAVGRHEVAAIHRGSEGDCEGAGPQPPIWLVPFFHLALFVGHPCPLSSAGACSQGNGALEEGGWWFPLPRSGMQRVSEEQQAQTPALGREHTTSCPKLWVQRSGHCYLPLLQADSLPAEPPVKSKTLMLGKFEGRRRRGRQRTRWLDGITDSVDVSLKAPVGGVRPP